MGHYETSYGSEQRLRLEIASREAEQRRQEFEREVGKQRLLIADQFDKLNKDEITLKVMIHLLRQNKGDAESEAIARELEGRSQNWSIGRRRVGC